MRKLLIFMLVLGLATVVNAQLTGVQLSIGGVTDGPGNVTEIIVLPCTELVIDVHGPFAYGWGGFVFIQDNDAYDSVGNGDPTEFVGMGGEGGEWGDMLGPPYLPMCSSYYYEKEGYPIVYPEAGDPDLRGCMRFEFATMDAGNPINGYGYYVNASAFGDVPGGREFDLLYHCCGPETVTINLWDTTSGEWDLQDTIVVHQIPEPATIALLGLGGLLLRRRK